MSSDPRPIVIFEAPGESITGVFCGTPYAYAVHRDAGQDAPGPGERCAGEGCERCAAEDAPTMRVLINCFLPAEGTMRVLEGSVDWLEDLLRTTRKYGLADHVYEIEHRGVQPDGLPRYLVLPEAPLSAADRATLRKTPRYNLASVSAGGDERAPLDTGASAPSDASAQVASDLKTGLRFVHAMAMQTRFMSLDNRARAVALAESLIAGGHLDLSAFEERREVVMARESARFEKQVHVKLAEKTDKYAITDLPNIDCAARVKACKGRCCTLVFPLSVQDLDERVVEWDYAVPYQIRQGDDGYCVHRSPETSACNVYDHRPVVCRTYSCRDDKRIWDDFDRWIVHVPESS